MFGCTLGAAAVGVVTLGAVASGDAAPSTLGAAWSTVLGGTVSFCAYLFVDLAVLLFGCTLGTCSVCFAFWLSFSLLSFGSIMFDNAFSASKSRLPFVFLHFFITFCRSLIAFII